MLCKPPGDEVGNLCVIEFLEHEMAVSVDVRVRQIDDLGVTAVSAPKRYFVFIFLWFLIV